MVPENILSEKDIHKMQVSAAGHLRNAIIDLASAKSIDNGRHGVKMQHILHQLRELLDDVQFENDISNDDVRATASAQVIEGIQMMFSKPAYCLRKREVKSVQARKARALENF